MSYFDDNEDRIVYGYGRRLARRETVKCAFCGTLTKWVEQEGKWRMMEMNNNFHICHPENPKKINLESKSMQIQIINIAQTQAMTKANKPYTVVEATFKNLTFQGKVEAKKIMPFGENSNAHKALINAQNGDVFDVQVVKNSAGYNDWVEVTPGVAGQETSAPKDPNAGYAQPARTGPVAGATPAPARTSTYETPEERAKKQVYIVRQSSLSAAIATLGAGAKSALKPSDVIAVAKEYEAFVFDTKADPVDSGFDNMDDDIPY